MALPRLSPDSTVLLVVDVQERLMPTIDAAARVEANCAILARAAGVLGMPVVCTEQYVKGLGHTAPHVRGALPSGAKVFEKTRFSALTPEVRAHLVSLHRPNVLVCGVEAHVCVLQTVLDLAAASWHPFHATDAISAGQPDQVAPAFRRMERAGSLPTGTLGAMYELMGDAGHPAFREILTLAKLVPKGA
jgi:nicotinamidase-related amidase